MTKYSVLTYNFGNYDSQVFEIKEKSPNAEYVYVTDNPDVKSDTWEVKVIENKWPNDIFRVCWEVRYNPFNYVKNDIVVRIDGSVEVLRNLDPLVQYFVEGDYEMAVMLHPYCDTIYNEYSRWIMARNYPVEQANKVIKYLASVMKYDVVNNKGLAQYNVMIHRNDKINGSINEGTMWLLKYLAMDDKEVDRLDQTIGSAVIQHFYPQLKLMYLGPAITNGTWFNWRAHSTGSVIEYKDPFIEPYFYNRQVNLCPLTIAETFDKFSNGEFNDPKFITNILNVQKLNATLLNKPFYVNGNA